MATPATTTVAIATRCSFETRDAFDLAQQQLPLDNSPTPKDIRRRPTKFAHPKPTAPVFVTSVKSDTTYALKTDAARKNDHLKTPYAPPSAFQHRVDSPPASWWRPGADFLAKFHVASNQDLRRRAALDQEGFLSDAASQAAGAEALELVATDLPTPRDPLSPPTGRRRPTPTPSPSKQDFQTRLPHTTRKSSNIELRLETIVDQDGLLPQLQEIREHQYREEPTLAVPFHAKFKPAPSLRPIGSPGNDRKT